MSTVQFTRVQPEALRWDPVQCRPFHAQPFASAVVDGKHVVKVSPRAGWTCTCDNDECTHPDDVAALILPSLLNKLDPPQETTA